MNIDNDKVAETLDEMAALFSTLANCFRGTGSGGKGASADGKAVKKPAKRAAATDEIDEDTLREKLTALNEAHGKEVMVAALASVGAGKLGEVDESQYAELAAKVDELMENPEAAEDAKPAKKPAAKKTAAKKTPTLAQVQAAAKALIAADEAAYKRLMKKLGKPSDMDPGDYADAIAAYEGAMPEEEEEDIDL